MPNWAKHTIWILIFLILLANHRQVGEWIMAFGNGLKGLFPAGLFYYEDPQARFMITGILIVAVVGIFKIYFENRSDRNKNP